MYENVCVCVYIYIYICKAIYIYIYGLDGNIENSSKM